MGSIPIRRSYRVELNMRICKQCGESFPFKIEIDGRYRNLQNRKFCLECSPFGKHNTRPDLMKPLVGKKNKSNGKAVTRYRQKLKKRLITYKGGMCKLCGYDKPVSRAYDFHHRNPSEKLFSISGCLCRSWETLKTEADKCDLLCRNCHAEVHEAEIKAG